MSKILVFGHRNPDSDAIGAAIGLARLEAALGADTEAVALGHPSRETAFALDHFGLDAPRVIERAAPSEVMLVDHNERQQSVADLDEVTILKVIDHHRVANFETTAPLYMRVEPVGCTCSILTRMYAENGVDIPPDTAGIMLSAIISDTLLLNSPTTTDADRIAAEELATIAGVDLADYGNRLLRAGTALGDDAASTIITRDAKSFTMGSSTVRVAQLTTVDSGEVLDRRDEFLTAMRAEQQSAGYDLYLLLITDVIACDSDLMVVGEPVDAVERALGVTVVDGHAFGKGIVSRKKQIVPQLTEILAGQE
ncbi:manganese-dependent inorganic pyrophosphatase [Gordonia jinghuaiqii]|uniref:inorganic diphosphatase n=1 Tax=Gordonia jinghuaiqii TaxID=2758710 RepID=A0A7D7LNY5_9ACTN|nr:manganese-dependent inorganic pyrophosphatase [Gordonia jinghuaiqii]MCR5976480.1 manganese-dependent inorganic pyrophosphatase [Gordonia jinghuaiqii]QMS99684.1 manganese-dependent inorganic pyrophosphatase [Gordonia jinghuaiqii]